MSMSTETMARLISSTPTSRTVVLGVAVGVALYLVLRKRHKAPPGPRGWPLIGNLIELTKGKVFQVVHRLAQEHGPVMTLSLGPKKVIVLSRIDVVQEALLKRKADFAGRTFSYSLYVMSEKGSDILTATYGPRWKLHRKLASKAIRHYLNTGSLNKTLSRSVAITTKLMTNQRGEFDPRRLLSLSVFNILSGMCFDKFRSFTRNDSSNTEEEKFSLFVDSLDTFADEIGTGFLEELIPPLRLCPTRKFRRMMGLIRTLTDSIRQEVVQHRNTFRSDSSRDFIDALLLAQQEAEQEEDQELLSQITDTHLTHTIANVFMAGIDTSRTTLHWTLLVMCLHPEVQKKVHQEVDAVIGAELDIRLAMRDRLPYTEAVLYETIRLRSAVPLGVPHETIVDSSVGGYDISKGTTVMISHQSLHMDPNQWDKPEEFRPERFLDTSGKMAPKPASWLPFSAGRRVCLGETLARPQLHLILAGIMRACSVRLAPGDTTDMDTSDKGFANVPNKYKVVVQSRI